MRPLFGIRPDDSWLDILLEVSAAIMVAAITLLIVGLIAIIFVAVVLALL